MALGPKEVFAVTLVTFALQGVGMGFVDGVACSLLSDLGTERHKGTVSSNTSFVAHLPPLHLGPPDPPRRLFSFHRRAHGE